MVQEKAVLKKIKDYHQKTDDEKTKKTRRTKNWRTARDDDGAFWLYFDKDKSGTNVLSTDVLKELDDILSDIESDLPAAVVIKSDKKGGFCAGADISEFQNIEDKGDIESMLRAGHKILDRLENLSVPTVAVIHGHCLGGGLELSLACDYRIGIKGSLQMGFPEVRLGLHPGLGGTFRLTDLIDPTVAMQMMLTGSSKHDGQCKKLGLVDDLVEERHYEAAIKAAIDGKLKAHKQNIKDKTLNSKAARALAVKTMRKKSEKKAPSKYYPAPYALIDLWEEHGGDRKAMQKGEVKSFAKLLIGDTAQNLIRVFFLRQAMKNQATGKSGVEHVHVIGAGAMGGDIAGWCALQGYRVTLADMENAPIAQAVKETARLCKDKHKSDIETRDILDRLMPDPKGLGASKADLVIEAVPEEIKIKHSVYKSIEPKMKKDAVLATNTSSMPLEQLSKGLKKPERLVGLHFFNPVSRMMLVEVVEFDKTDKKIHQQAINFANAIGKLPTPVESYPGFLVNRALMPYLMEALVLFDEGVEKETIDKAAEDYGMPMGPIELADQVGLDICLHVAGMLKDSLDVPLADIPDWLQKKVDDGELGKKTGKGFYEWKDGKAQKDEDKAGTPDDEMTDRLILPLLNACVECYRQDVVKDLDIIDGAMIFGTGFAPFRGGPMHYAKNRGVEDIVETLKTLADKHGERFAPDKGWDAIKKEWAEKTGKTE